DLLEGLPRRREVRPELAEPQRQARPRRRRAEEAAATPALATVLAPEARAAAPVRRLIAAPAPAAAAAPDARPLEAGLHLGQLGRRQRRDVPPDPEGLPARLELRHDLRDRPLLVHGAEHQAARDRSDARKRRDLLRLALREGELRPRQEEVVDEV